MAALQISAGLPGLRIFKKKPVQQSMPPQSSITRRHGTSFRVHQFELNSAQGATARHFVRPDCPPDSPKQPSPKGLLKSLGLLKDELSELNQENDIYAYTPSPRSPLEEVGLYQSKRRMQQYEESLARKKWGIFGF